MGGGVRVADLAHPHHCRDIGHTRTDMAEPTDPDRGAAPGVTAPGPLASERAAEGVAPEALAATNPPSPSGRIARLLAGAEARAEPFVDSVTSRLDAAVDSIREMPGMRVRRVRKLGRHALPSLADLHPDARRARPVTIGLRHVPIEEIRGTAVGGGDQRGGDFLPLRPFRGRNWAGRWQRLRRAHDALVSLPPVDLVKFDGGYWVVDGHNRVALALYNGQVDVDASIVELVPPGGHRTEAVGSLAAEVEGARELRTRAARATDDADRERSG